MTPLSDAVKVRVIRAILGLGSSEFADKLGISIGTLTSWEKDRYGPEKGKRERLMELCREHKIAFLPSGMPVPLPDALIFKQEKSNGRESVSGPIRGE